jgi:hypothetical protein
VARQNKAVKAHSDEKSRAKVKRTVVEKLSDDLAGLAQLPGGPIAAVGGSTIQAARLGDVRLQTVQRQALAAQIGQMQGNRHLQKVIASQYGDVNVIQTELTANTPMVPTKRVAGNTVQRSFWGRVWRAMRSAGRAIASGVRAAGRAIARGVRRLGGHLRDAGLWLVNLIRDLPGRLGRLAITLCEGLSGVASFIPDAIRALASGGLRGFADWLWERARSGGAWVLSLLSRVFDVLGGPEIVQFIAHLVTRATPLTEAEMAAASSVLGPNAIRYGDVRIAEGGLLNLVFRLNQGRAFASWHTINMPSGSDGRSNLDIVVHELVHVYQNEKVGTVYLGQAIYAQMTVGYGYGGAAGLTADRAAGKHYRDYNREQQAQIAQDYYTLRQSGGDTTAYQPFIAELRAGDL